MNLDSLKKLISNEVYKTTLSLISTKVGIEVNDFINPAILNIGLKSINSSSIREEDIYDILENRNSQFSKFCIARIIGFKNLGAEQEYPVGEEPDESDNEETFENEQLSIISLLGYLVEFFHLRNNDSIGLVNYLKRIRLPKAEKHKKEIEVFFQFASS